MFRTVFKMRYALLRRLSAQATKIPKPAVPQISVALTADHTLSSLPRLLSLNQLASRAGVHRSAVTALMLSGQVQPFAMQEVGNGRDQFLFSVEAVQIVARLTGPAESSINPLL